jgi:hypothetical protein
MKSLRIIKLLAGASLAALFAAPEVYKSLPTANFDQTSRVSARHDDTTHFIAAILRADGTLVPFAQYGNGGWANPWPAPPQAAEGIYAETTEVIPHSLGNLPEPWFKQCGEIPKTWYFWSSATTSAVLNASSVLQVENHSQTNWALTTDFPKQNAEDNHHHNLGVALTVNEKVEPLIEIKPQGAETADLLSFIKELFNRAETTELNKIRAERSPGIDWSTPFLSASSEERAKVRMSVTKLYRTTSPVSGEYLYYFEAEKDYEKAATSSDQACADVSLFQGWMEADERGGLGLMDSRVFFTDCDMKGPSFATPLGLLRLKNATFLFVTEHGWEDECYVILELDDSGLHKVLETFGG